MVKKLTRNTENYKIFPKKSSNVAEYEFSSRDMNFVVGMYPSYEIRSQIENS